MQYRSSKRLAALVFALALAAPAAWAAPGTGAWLDLGGPWGWLARIMNGWGANVGPCIDPDGKPASTAVIGAGRRAEASKEGPCISPEGKPTCGT